MRLGGGLLNSGCSTIDWKITFTEALRDERQERNEINALMTAGAGAMGFSCDQNNGMEPRMTTHEEKLP
jgi:hypothetical protein